MLRIKIYSVYLSLFCLSKILEYTQEYETLMHCEKICDNPPLSGKNKYYK